MNNKQKLDQDSIKNVIDDVSSFINSPQSDTDLKQVIENLIKDLQDELKKCNSSINIV